MSQADDATLSFKSPEEFTEKMITVHILQRLGW